jgi:1-phosphofructokinase family hexose kinase
VIIAAGLTPAWQQIVRFDRFRAGEVNRALDVHWCASGKVLNVGIALAHLGAPAETIALVGGSTGEQIDRELRSLGIHARWIKAHWSTRVCTTILDIDSARATELVENAGPVTAGELDEFLRVYLERVAGADFAILTGSLPAGAPPGFFRELLLETRCPAILDIRGEELIAALAGRVFLVKPNREELARTMGKDLSTDRMLHAAMQELNDRGAEWVFVSDGARTAWASSQGQFFRFAPPKVEPVNPIGSGDCLAAAVAWALVEGASPNDAMRLGIAAAVENVGQLLPGRLDPHAVRTRAESIAAERITR